MRAPLCIAAIFGWLAIAYGQSSATEQQYINQLIANPRDSLAHYNLAEYYFAQKNYLMAVNQYREALSGSLEPRWLEAWSHIGLGKAYDFAGRHDRAMKEYELAAKTSGDAPGARDVAEAYLKDDADQSDKPLLTLPLFRAPLHIFLTEPTASIDPEYSEEALAAGLEGTVFVDVGIQADGTPANPRVRPSLSPGFGLDEKAIEAISHWRFAPPPSEPTPKPALVGVNFLLPSKLSRWHLVYASFEPPDGATRPVFLAEDYPLGPGISVQAIDEGAVISSIRRFATVTLQFDVDESGRPANFDVLAASAPVWGPEAVAMVRDWRFKPGTKDGNPVPVPCTLDLIWGQKIWTADSLEKMRAFMSGVDQDKITEAAVDRHEILAVREIADGAQSTSGAVMLAVLIDENGVPADVRVVHGLNTDLDAKAVRAAREEHFKPALLNGVAIPITIRVEVTFH